MGRVFTITEVESRGHKLIDTIPEFSLTGILQKSRQLNVKVSDIMQIKNEIGSVDVYLKNGYTQLTEQESVQILP